jgi:hypothetical protein
MFWRFGVPLIIFGVLAVVLLGWAVAYAWERRHREDEAEVNRRMEEEKREHHGPDQSA